MAFAISIQTDSSPIEAILKKLSDFDTYKDDLYVEIVGYGVTSTQERFFNQHNVDGNPWKQSWRAKLQNFLSCLSGSEQNELTEALILFFLSCLSGSERWR